MSYQSNFQLHDDMHLYHLRHIYEYLCNIK